MGLMKERLVRRIGLPRVAEILRGSHCGLAGAPEKGYIAHNLLGSHTIAFESGPLGTRSFLLPERTLADNPAGLARVQKGRKPDAIHFCRLHAHSDILQPEYFDPGHDRPKPRNR